jgi:hypothetical protein
MSLTVLFSGNYDPDYNRTSMIRARLLHLGHSVTGCPFRNRDAAARLAGNAVL